MIAVDRKIWGAATFALALNVFLFHRVGTLGSAILMIMLGLMTVFVFGDLKKVLKVSVESAFLGMLVTILAISLVVDSPVRLALVYISSIAGMMFAAYAMVRGYTPRGILESFLSYPQIVAAYIGSIMDLLVGASATKKPKVQGQARSPWQIGLLVGIPLVLWLTSLLSNADPVFASFVNRLVSKEFLHQLPVRTFVTLFAFGFWIPAIFLKFSRGFVSPIARVKTGNYIKEMMIILAMVVAVMGIFLYVQWPYVFVNVAAETSLARYGVATYSEYVQKGFGELIKVLVVLTGVTWATYLVYRENKKSRDLSTMLGLQILMSVETVVFVVSIIRRVLLYMSFHGLSLARMYGLIFLAWVVGMMITLGARFILQRGLVKYEMLWTVAILLFAISVNMESLVVNNPPTVNERVDYSYLSRMSGDGYEGWKMSYEWTRKLLGDQQDGQGINVAGSERQVFYDATLVVRRLIDNYDYLDDIYGNGDSELSSWDRFLSWNYRDYAVYKKMSIEMPKEALVYLNNQYMDAQDRIDNKSKVSK